MSEETLDVKDNKKKRDKTLDAILKEKPNINRQAEEVLKCFTFENVNDISLTKVTEELVNCHPYVKLLKVSRLEIKSQSDKYCLISNEVVSIELHPTSVPIIRLYIVSNLNTATRAKYK